MRTGVKGLLFLIIFTLAVGFATVSPGLWVRSHAPKPHDYTADYRYTFKFEDGTTLWTDMPPDFGYLDTMTCVYVGVNQKGAHFSRVCRPADQTILVTDKYAQEVKDPLR